VPKIVKKIPQECEEALSTDPVAVSSDSFAVVRCPRGMVSFVWDGTSPNA